MTAAPFARPLGLLCLLLALTPVHAAGKAVSRTRQAAPAPAAITSTPPPPTLTIAYLGQTPATLPPRPYFDPVPSDAGVQGARLGRADDDTTGEFTGQRFQLREVLLPAEADPAVALAALAGDGIRHVLLDLPAAAVRRLQAEPSAQQLLLYDVATSDDELRAEDCRGNVLHLLPSRAMRADALAQYLAKKRWKDWFLVIGPEPEDQRYAAAIRHAARKFGARIVAEKHWSHPFEDRRSPESEVPVFTQGLSYDVLVVADETGRFADLLPYRTWDPRPVAGSAGLIASAWSTPHEMWGALQLQNRFRAQAGRWMTERDYGAWLALRAIGEAATRVKSLEFEAIKSYLLGDRFTVAGFKGVPLSFRSWDRQLRQPILLGTERNVVAVAPLEGYLHPQNELDTLGFDAPESRCRL